MTVPFRVETGGTAISKLMTAIGAKEPDVMC